MLVLIVAVLALVAVVAVADDAMADMGPMVERPGDRGPMLVGQFDTVIRCSTKSYDTQLRVYYPAANNGMGAIPDPSGAPYMTIVWLPFYGGGYDMLDFQGEHLASWGAVVVAFGVNWNDFQNSASASDMNDLLDMLEDLNETVGNALFGMVDKEAYGICGHSSGGGLSLVRGAQVTRFRAIQSFGAAIGFSSVDAIAPLFAGRPVLLQVGQEDVDYIANSRRAYDKVGAPCSLVETIGGHHSGPFQDHMYVAFYKYHLAGDEDYFTFLYGDDAVDVAADGLADVYFKLGGDHFFPPKLTSTVSVRYTPMDQVVTLNATVRGYQRANDPDLVHGWDVDGDGVSDVMPTGGPNTTFIFTSPGQYDVRYNYSLGRLILMGNAHRVDVSNVLPVAVAGLDVEVDHDGYIQLDGSGSLDTPSDAGRLLYKWVFSDGFGTNVTAHPTVSRQYMEVGVVVATLTVYDPHGGETSDSLNVTVINVPPSVTTGDRLSVGEDAVARFDGTGHDTASHEGVLRYRWDFGDGMGTDWAPTPGATHAYTRSGNYTATLSVKDPEGAVGKVTTTVLVLNVAPEATIEYPLDGSSAAKDEPVEFKATGTDTPSDEVDLRFMWDFGDGDATDWLGRRDTQMFHTYSRGGVYEVVLSVIDTDGATATSSSRITIVNDPPEATIVRPWPSASVFEDAVVKFDGKGSDTPGDQDGLTYEWVIDGVTYVGDRAEHTFTKAGVYEAEFRVTDADGAIGSLTVEVTVENVAPEAIIDANRTAVGTGGSVSFSVDILDTLSDMDDHYVVWDFGDGGTSYDIMAAHVFGTNGTYRVRVTVEDDDGDEVTATITVLVTDPPKAPVDPTDDGPSASDGRDIGFYIIAGILVAMFVAVMAVVLYLLRKDMTGDGEEDLEDAQTGPSPDAPGEEGPD